MDRVKENPAGASGASSKTLHDVLDTYPDLTPCGFACRGQINRKETQADFENRLSGGRAEWRAYWTFLVDDFDRAARFCASIEPTKNINTDAGSSYGLKHVAEPRIGYTCNGAFIAAAISCGFK